MNGSFCNDETFTTLDLSSFEKLRVIEVGDYSFAYVKEVKLIGLHELERVVIGANSFTKYKNDYPYYANLYNHFYLKDCERVKELKIGCFSFNSFRVCEIANVPSLEVIKMGKMYEVSCSFWCASLELKSSGDGMK